MLLEFLKYKKFDKGEAPPFKKLKKKKKKKVLKFWSLQTSLDRTTKLVVVVVGSL